MRLSPVELDRIKKVAIEMRVISRRNAVAIFEHIETLEREIVAAHEAERAAAARERQLAEDDMCG